jgi:hypothetical protein
MQTLPAHLQAILDGRITIAPSVAIVPPRDRTPQFTPSQSGSAPRARIDAANWCELESHDAPTISDNSEGVSFVPCE